MKKTEIETLRMNTVARATQDIQVRQSMISDNEFVLECKVLINYIDTLYSALETAPTTLEELQLALDDLDSDKPERLAWVVGSINTDF
jgi:hypothetical protein